MKIKVIAVVGATASGKTKYSIELAKKINGEIVSADSRQVFKGLDIGSGKVTPEETQGVPHWLLDVAEPNDFFSVKDFQKLAYSAIDDIHSRGVKAFMVGGTGLYVNSVTDGYNLTGKQSFTVILPSPETQYLCHGLLYHILPVSGFARVLW